MNNMADSLRELPFRGDVKEIAVFGNGKRCRLRITLPDGAAFAIPLSYGRTSVGCCEGILVTTVGENDVSLAVQYLPQAGYRMRLVRGEVDYPGSDEDWASDCEVWAKPSAESPPQGSWAVAAVRLELVAIRSAAAVA